MLGIRNTMFAICELVQNVPTYQKFVLYIDIIVLQRHNTNRRKTILG